MKKDYDPKGKGERTVAAILNHFIQQGKAVSLPWGDNQRYDMILDDGGKLFRIQCKTGKLRNGVICVPVCSNNWFRKTKRSYHGEIDFFVAYCKELNKFYRIPIEDVGNTEIWLRVEKAKNGQQKNIRMASKYEI